MKSYKQFSIAKKLLWFVLPLTAVLIITLSYASIIIAKSAIKENVINNLKNTADLKVSKIDDFYDKIYANVFLLQNYGVFEKQLPIIIHSDSILEIKELAKADVFKPLNDFQKAYDYHCIKLLNPKGEIILSTRDFEAGSRLGDPDQKAFKKGQKEIYFSDIFEEENIFKMIVTAPLFANNQFCGLIAVEINMESVYKMIQNTTGLGSTGETLIGKETEKGALFLNPLRHDPSAALNREAITGSAAARPILEAVKGNSSWSISKDYRKQEVVAVWRYIPSLNWGLVAKMDTEELYAPIYNIRNIILTIGGVVFVIAIFLSLLFANYLTKPIASLKVTIQTLGKGNAVSKELVKTTEDEIGEMIDATNNLAKFQKNIIQFAEDIGKGNFNSTATIDKEGNLGKALVNMSANLQAVAEEDEKRNWATAGEAKFAEILRANDDTLEVLSDLIISNLIKYLGANQGSLFVIDDNSKVMTLQASYAWERKKYKEKEILLGEGLIGSCWQEAETIYITDIPSNYINITSGLGEANPTSVLIVPMKIEETVYGVVELASFTKFKNHQIKFVEKIAESIASTISSAKTNIQTSKLLEESNEMTEQMQAQEEEIRQNMEEMQATQEELERTISAKDKIIEALQSKVNL